MADERTEKQKVQEITDKLEEGLKELFESEKYKTYLSTMSKFHNYSFNNTFPIYTKQEGDGGIFVGENYKPYMNTLTTLELKVLQEMYELAEGIHKKVLFQIICKYGPDKLEL